MIRPDDYWPEADPDLSGAEPDWWSFLIALAVAGVLFIGTAVGIYDAIARLP